MGKNKFEVFNPKKSQDNSEPNVEPVAVTPINHRDSNRRSDEYPSTYYDKELYQIYQSDCPYSQKLLKLGEKQFRMKLDFYFNFQNGGKMLKAKPERITYAQEKLITLIEGRKLRAWCLENNLNHSIIYRIALGEAHPTYKIISSSTHLIAPIEWLFYTDEPLPYEPRLLPQWDASKNSAFVLKHRNDYRELEKLYGITETAAYNMCVVYRAKPSISFIRECCKDTDPIEFFTDGELPESPASTEPFIPERGDIVNIQGRQVLVLSKKSFSEKTKKIVGVPVITAGGEGTALEGAKTKGFALSSDIASFSLSSKMRPLFIESINESVYGRILSEARAILEP